MKTKFATILLAKKELIIIRGALASDIEGLESLIPEGEVTDNWIKKAVEEDEKVSEIIENAINNNWGRKRIK